MITAMHIKYPSKQTLIVKTYLNVAYRRIHENAQITSTCIKILVRLDFLCMWLEFGTTPKPIEYIAISEAAIDTGDDILMDASWETTNLQSTHRYLIPRDDYLPPSEPLTCRPTGSIYLSKGGFKVWIHLWHHIHHHLWRRLVRARQKLILIGHLHHI